MTLAPLIYEIVIVKKIQRLGIISYYFKLPYLEMSVVPWKKWCALYYLTELKADGRVALASAGDGTI